MDCVKEYKYLGFTLDEYMTYRIGIKIVVDSAGQAVGSVVNKLKICKDLDYLTYTQLYDACVSPKLNSAAGVWGFKDSKESDHIHNRAIWCFLGKHKFAPLLAAQGDMGWVPESVTRKCEMIRLCNCFVNMAEIKKTKQVFLHRLLSFTPLKKMLGYNISIGIILDVTLI